MKNSLLVLAMFGLMISCSTDEADDLYLAKQLEGSYSLTVLVKSWTELVKSWTEDVGRPEERFIPVEHTMVRSYPYVSGEMTLESGQLSAFIINTWPDEVILDLEAFYGIMQEWQRGAHIPPLEFDEANACRMDITYSTESAQHFAALSVFWDGDTLKMPYTHAGTGIHYIFYWLKE